MGGNQILIFLGQEQYKIPTVISKAVVFSVPADLKSSAEKLAHWSNKIYMTRFIHYLGQKVKAKAQLFPGQISAVDYHKAKTFKDFDDRENALLHYKEVGQRSRPTISSAESPSSTRESTRSSR